MSGGVQNTRSGSGNNPNNYLNYNVNTSLDRRMRQQMNAISATSSVVGSGQKMSPRMLQQQAQQMGLSPQLQQMQYQQQTPQLSRREKLQLHQQLKGTSPSHHSQSSSLDVDWSEFGGLMNNSAPVSRVGQSVSQQQPSHMTSSFISIKSAHLQPSRLTAPGLTGGLSLGVPSAGGVGVSSLSGTSPSGASSFLGGAMGHRANHSTGSLWPMHEEEPEEHYQAAFQQPHAGLSGSTGVGGLPMNSSHSSFEFDLESDTSTSSSAANVYAGLWGDTSSTGILSSSFPSSELNVNASAFNSQQFQMPPRGSR